MEGELEAMETSVVGEERETTTVEDHSARVESETQHAKDDLGKDEDGQEAKKFDPNEQAKRVLDFWNEFDLDGQRLKLDQQGLEITDNQEKSVRSRKKLAEVTKDFRKLSDPESRLKRLGPLMKSYQEEIDRLTKRARFAESGFLGLYKALYEAPDPVKVLAQAISDRDRVRELSFEVKRLSAELEEYETEFSNLKNQDITIRSLEVKIEQLEREIDDRVALAVEEKEQELIKANAERSAQSVQQDEELKSQLEQVKEMAREFQKLHEDAQEQLFELRTAMEEKEAARQTEIDMLLEDASRANIQITSLEREAAQLRSQLAEEREAFASTSTSTGSAQMSGNDRQRLFEMEDELIRNRETIDNLRLEISRWRAEVDTAKMKHSQALDGVVKEREDAEKKLHDLQAELEKRPTAESMETLQRQLRMLQASEFNVDVQDDSDPNMELSENERLVLRRVRKLEAVATSLRVELEQCKDKLGKAQKEKDFLQERFDDQTLLVKKLESELEQQLSIAPGSTANIPTESSSSNNQQENDRLHMVAPSASNRSNNHETEEDVPLFGVDMMNPNPQNRDLESTILESALLGDKAGGVGELIMVENEHDDGASMLTIVHEQRNRFRKRMLELEAEKDNLAAKSVKYIQEIDKLKQDNVKLYEKIKYLQSYGVPPSGSAQYGGQTRKQRLNANQLSEVRLNMMGGGDSDVESRYKDLYEDQMNPFTDFSIRERRRRYKGLNTAEKITLNATKFFLSNKYTRSFLFFYAVGLHLLVFFALWFHTHSSYKKCTHFQHGADHPSQTAHLPQNVQQLLMGSME